MDSYSISCLETDAHKKQHCWDRVAFTQVSSWIKIYVNYLEHYVIGPILQTNLWPKAQAPALVLAAAT